MNEIRCPSCGCVVHLEWKTNKETEKNVCDMEEDDAKRGGGE